MEKLQKLYSESNVTLVQLAVKTGISTSTIHRYVSGKIKILNPDYYNPIYKALEDLHPKKEITETKEANASVDINTTELKEQINKNVVVNTQKIPHKGEIWYIKGSSVTYGKEIWTGSQNRPCVVIQNSKLNNVGTFLVVYLTKQPREFENPTLVTIKTNVMSTAICSQVNAISKDRFVNCVGAVTEIELSLIERAVLIAFDIKINPKSEIQHAPDYIAIKTELSVYKKLYEDYIKIHSIR